MPTNTKGVYIVKVRTDLVSPNMQTESSVQSESVVSNVTNHKVSNHNLLKIKASHAINCNDRAWYVDSGASDHICCERSSFSSFESLSPSKIELGEGYSTITGKGTVELETQVRNQACHVTLKDFAKDFKRNLTSVGKIDRAGSHVHVFGGLLQAYKRNPNFSLIHAKIQEDNLCKVIGKVKSVNNSVVINDKVQTINGTNVKHVRVNEKKQIDINSNSKPIVVDNGIKTEKVPNDVLVRNYAVLRHLWHQRFAHQNYRGLDAMSKDIWVYGLEFKKSKDVMCYICRAAKATRGSFPSNGHRVADKPLQLLHMDVWGKAPVTSFGQANYLFTIVDDATCFAWNCYPHSRIGFKIPQIKLRQKEMSVRHLKKPGSLCHVYIDKTRRNKLESRSWIGFLVGYALDTRGFRVWNPEDNTVTETKHVSIDETRNWKSFQGPSLSEDKQNIIQTQDEDKFFDATGFITSDSDDSDNDDVASHYTPPGSPTRHTSPVSPPRRRAQSLTETRTPGTVPVGRVQRISDRRETMDVFHTPLAPAKAQKAKARRPRLAVRVESHDGWDREEVRRTSGASKGRIVVYYYTPEGKRLRSKREVINYFEDRGSRYDIDDFNSVPTDPILPELDVTFSSSSEDDTTSSSDEDLPISVGATITKCRPDEEETIFPYRLLVGSLMFLANRTRPDILFSTIFLSQYNNSHSEKHVKYLLQILQYVVNTRNLEIDLTSCENELLSIYTDASWATDIDSSKSFGGYIVMMGNTPICWSCGKQTSICTSIMEAEFTSLVNAIKEGFWLSNIFKELPLLCYDNIPDVKSDSLTSIQFMQNDIENSKTKHIRMVVVAVVMCLIYCLVFVTWHSHMTTAYKIVLIHV
uniref:MBD domain-containing protein n=1 Tax=Strigamia maritima TaxID=126957 RepID=T1JD93_STRMM